MPQVTGGFPVNNGSDLGWLVSTTMGKAILFYMFQPSKTINSLPKLKHCATSTIRSGTPWSSLNHGSSAMVSVEASHTGAGHTRQVIAESYLNNGVVNGVIVIILNGVTSG